MEDMLIFVLAGVVAVASIGLHFVIRK